MLRASSIATCSGSPPFSRRDSPTSSTRDFAISRFRNRNLVAAPFRPRQDIRRIPDRSSDPSRRFPVAYRAAARDQFQDIPYRSLPLISHSCCLIVVHYNKCEWSCAIKLSCIHYERSRGYPILYSRVSSLRAYKFPHSNGRPHHATIL